MTTRILHLLPSLEPSWAESQVRLLVRGLPSDELECHVCVLRASDPGCSVTVESPARVTMIGMQHRLDAPAVLRLVRHVKHLRPDLIHAWTEADLWGRIVGRLTHARVIAALNTSSARSSMLGESRSIVNSQPLGSAMAAKPTVIASGVELTGAPAMSRAEFLSQLGLPPDARLMGAVGRLVPDQRIKDVIWAADLLKCIRSDVHVLLVGDGPQRERLQRYRSQVRVDDQVHFLGIRPDLRNWLGHLDVLCLARDDLALPQIVLDAMATGVPVVAADSPGAREGIQHEETGRLFPVGDRALLARYVNELLDDPVLARRLANAARQRVAADFSPAEMVRRYAEVYRVVAGKE